MTNKQPYTFLSGFDSIDPAKWNKLLSGALTPSIFQAPEMFRFFEKVKGYTPFVFAVEDDKGEIPALMSGAILNEGSGIKAKMTKRAIVFAGPLIADRPDNKEALSFLLTHLTRQMSKEAIYIETRNLNDYSEFKACFLNAGWEFNNHYNFHVDCTDEAVIKKNMSSSKVRQVKKSIKEGAEIVIATQLDEVREFHAILEDLYKTKVKTPLPDFSFFEEFLHSDLGIYILIRYEGRIVGGIMCPILDNRVIYELFVCGIDGQINNVYPSIVATWAAIDYANKNGIKTFDFMGAGSPDQDYGVREFKSKFGGELLEQGRFRKVFKPLLFNVGKTGVKLLKKVK